MVLSFPRARQFLVLGSQPAACVITSFPPESEGPPLHLPAIPDCSWDLRDGVHQICALPLVLFQSTTLKLASSRCSVFAQQKEANVCLPEVTVARGVGVARWQVSEET